MAMLMTTEVKPLEFPFFFFFLGSSGESFGANEEYLIASELLTFSRLVSEQELGTESLPAPAGEHPPSLAQREGQTFKGSSVPCFMCVFPLFRPRSGEAAT